MVIIESTARVQQITVSAGMVRTYTAVRSWAGKSIQAAAPVLQVI